MAKFKNNKTTQSASLFQKAKFSQHHSMKPQPIPTTVDYAAKVQSEIEWQDYLESFLPDSYFDYLDSLDSLESQSKAVRFFGIEIKITWGEK